MIIYLCKKKSFALISELLVINLYICKCFSVKFLLVFCTMNPRIKEYTLGNLKSLLVCFYCVFIRLCFMKGVWEINFVLLIKTCVIIKWLSMTSGGFNFRPNSVVTVVLGPHIRIGSRILFYWSEVETISNKRQNHLKEKFIYETYIRDFYSHYSW